MISIRYRYKLYGIYDPSSSIAFIGIKESNLDDSEEGGSGGNDNSSCACNDNREGGNPTILQVPKNILVGT